MNTLKEDFIKIYKTSRGVLALMILNLILSVGLLIFSVINLNPNTAVVKIGYGDIGGYRDGTWVEMITFPLLALVCGLLHNIIALRIFHKRGSGMAQFFLITTIALIFSTFLVLIRLLGEI